VKKLAPARKAVVAGVPANPTDDRTTARLTATNAAARVRPHPSAKGELTGSPVGYSYMYPQVTLKIVAVNERSQTMIPGQDAMETVFSCLPPDACAVEPPGDLTQDLSLAKRLSDHSILLAKGTFGCDRPETEQFSSSRYTEARANLLPRIAMASVAEQNRR